MSVSEVEFNEPPNYFKQINNDIIEISAVGFRKFCVRPRSLVHLVQKLMFTKTNKISYRIYPW